jgi:hypothetical protein
MEILTTPFVLSFITSVVVGGFTAIVLGRWWRQRRPYMLAWGIGLAFYTVGAFSQMVLAVVWSPLFFALWYWAGALMVAPWLGQGTAYLLIRRGNIARNLQMALLLVTCMTLPWTLFFTEFNADAWQPGSDMTALYRDLVDETGAVIEAGILTGPSRGTVRFFSPIMNVWGTALLVGGALYSAWVFQRKGILRNRVIGNWLIAIGALFPAAGGLLIRLGDPSFKYVGELVGAVLIFAGFLYATRPAAPGAGDRGALEDQA